MTEEEARSWIRDHFGVSRETSCAAFAGMILRENIDQNLVSPASLLEIWARHIVDSAQLLDFAVSRGSAWCDIGSGAGFPGMVIAALSDYTVTMVEPRRKRASFLVTASERLGLDQRVSVVQQRAETASLACLPDVISARAVAPLTGIFQAAHHLAGDSTIWVLPKGRKADEELDEASKRWRGEFHVEQSITRPEAKIVVARHVRPR